MEAAIALATLAGMEIVLGIDNIVFIAILTSRLPQEQQPKARRMGLGLALIARILLLFSISFVMTLDTPFFYISDILEPIGIPTGFLEGEEDSGDKKTVQRPEHDEAGTTHATEHSADAISIKDMILLLGGLFLIVKSVREIHHKIEGEEEKHATGENASFTSVLVQIALLDIIFSLDSVITAVGMVKHIWIMVTAVIIAISVMMIFAEPISRFVHRHPTIKMLALSFLILIGVLLVAEGFDQPLDKGYIYFAMVFSLIVEMLNMGMRRHLTPAPPV